MMLEVPSLNGQRQKEREGWGRRRKRENEPLHLWGTMCGRSREGGGKCNSSIERSVSMSLFKQRRRQSASEKKKRRTKVDEKTQEQEREEGECGTRRGEGGVRQTREGLKASDG